jgi:AcrR family transcriptional regulator
VTAAKDQEAAPRGPGRPRDEEIGQRVRAAALAEVAERGSVEVTLASIARRAGVAKSTVYLRWPRVLELLAEAVTEAAQWRSTPDTGSLRGDLTALANLLVQVSMVTPLLELHLQFIAMEARAPEIYRRFQGRDIALGVGQGRVVFERARERGEIDDHVDLDQAANAFIGALLMRTLMTPGLAVSSFEGYEPIVDFFVENLIRT